MATTKQRINITTDSDVEKALRSAAKRTQLLVATQSVTLLNQLDPEHLIITEHDGIRTTAQRLSDRLPFEKLTEWLNEYAIGELWEKNVLGGRPR